MVTLGIGNSRMKDFFDIWYLARTFEFEEATLVAAIQATFARRQTPMPRETPVALTATFADDPAKVAQWRAFVARSRLVSATPSLSAVIAVLAAFVKPVLMGQEEGQTANRVWTPGTDAWTGG